MFCERMVRVSHQQTTVTLKANDVTADEKTENLRALVCYFEASELSVASEGQTHFHKVGVDVIGAHNVGIGALQDDPGVVDL